MSGFVAPQTLLGYRVTVTPQGPSLEIFVARDSSGTLPQQFHMDPEEVLAFMAVAAQAIRDAVNPPNLGVLLQVSMRDALSAAMVAKGWWTAGV